MVQTTYKHHHYQSVQSNTTKVKFLNWAVKKNSLVFSQISSDVTKTTYKSPYNRLEEPLLKSIQHKEKIETYSLYSVTSKNSQGRPGDFRYHE